MQPRDNLSHLQLFPDTVRSAEQSIQRSSSHTKTSTLSQPVWDVLTELRVSLCSRFPTRSRKPLLPSIWSAHSVLLNAHPNLKSLSAASVQEEMYNYLRRMPRDFWLFYLLDIQVWLLYRGFWVLQMCSNTERQLWSSHGTYFRDL